MTEPELKEAALACGRAFRRYIKEANATHRMLSRLTGPVTVEQRLAVNAQHLRESEAQIAYVATREALFEVLRVPATSKSGDGSI